MEHLHPRSPPISPRIQRLLSRYFDGEVGWWGKYRAEKVLRTNESAQEFFGALDEARSMVTSFDRQESAAIARSIEQAGVSMDDIWRQISARIDQEQYADALIAKSGNSSRVKNRFKFDFGEWVRPLGWSASGAVVSAAAVLLVVGPGIGGGLIARNDIAPQPQGIQLASTNAGAGSFSDSEERNSGPVRLAEGSTPQASFGSSMPLRMSMPQSVTSVSLSGDGRGMSDSSMNGSMNGEAGISDISEAIAAALAARARREAQLGTPFSSPARRARRAYYDASSSNVDLSSRSSQRAPQAVEVDWMRSDGRVRVFHDPSEQAAFIWVNPSRAMLERSASIDSPGSLDLVPGSVLGEESLRSASAMSQVSSAVMR